MTAIAWPAEATTGVEVEQPVEKAEKMQPDVRHSRHAGNVGEDKRRLRPRLTW
jgi:hypothetical protein